MRKIPCLFEREFHGRSRFTLRETVTPGCEWVLAGEGAATIKRDGTACMVAGGALYKRYDAKRDPKSGEFRTPPAIAIPCSDPDPETGHWPHWVLVGEEPESRWHREAWSALELRHVSPCLRTRIDDDDWNQATAANYQRTFDESVPCTCSPVLGALQLADGTYELCGPKIGANAERLEALTFFRHGSELAGEDLVRTHAAIGRWLEAHDHEGIVFHHPNGQMAKIRRADYGLPWGAHRGAP